MSSRGALPIALLSLVSALLAGCVEQPGEEATIRETQASTGDEPPSETRATSTSRATPRPPSSPPASTVTDPQSDTAPSIRLRADPSSGRVPLDVTFFVDVDDDHPASVAWTFDADGDGAIDESGTGPPTLSPVHYGYPGRFLAQLDLTDGPHEAQAVQEIEVLPPDHYEAVRQAMADVPCQTLPALDIAMTENLLPLAQLPLEGMEWGEVDVQRGLALLARFSGGGFDVVDVSQPLAPVWLATYFGPDGLDVKFAPDGQRAFLAHGGGIDIVDVTDPADPRLVGAWNGDYAHMIYAIDIKGSTYLFVAPNGWDGIRILRLQGDADSPELVQVGQSSILTLPEGGPMGPHDMFVRYEEDLDRWILYSADGFHGWAAHDVTDPSNPTFVGGFLNPEAQYVHSVQAATINGKRYVVTTGEIGLNHLRVYDATILEAPILLGVWQAPAGVGGPQHNVNIAGDHLYIAHYSRGVYVFNLSGYLDPTTAHEAVLLPVAHYPGSFPVSIPLAFGAFWDVVVEDGVLYMGHMTQGLHIVGFGCNVAGDAALTSPG